MFIPKYIKAIRSAKCNTSNSEFQEINLRNTWNLVNTLTKKKSTKRSQNCQNTDTQFIPNLFNSYFVDIGPS